MNFTYIEIKNSLKELGIRELENLQYDIINEQNKRMEKLKKMKTKNKKGCGKMYCAIEGCGKIDESHTAYCIEHGRSVHNICGENGLCSKCKKIMENKNDRINGRNN